MAYTGDTRAAVRRVGQLVALIAVLVMVLALVFQTGCSGDDAGDSGRGGKSRQASGSEGDAPNFKLNSLDGKTVELKSLRGKIVVIDFWAIWCPPCRITLPLMNKIYEKTRGKNVEVFGISTDRVSSQKVRKFVEKNNLLMPILHDRNGTVSRKYGVRGIPTMFIIDQQGDIYDRHVGADRLLDKKVLRKIDQLLGE